MRSIVQLHGHDWYARGRGAGRMYGLRLPDDDGAGLIRDCPVFVECSRFTERDRRAGRRRTDGAWRLLVNGVEHAERFHDRDAAMVRGLADLALEALEARDA